MIPRAADALADARPQVDAAGHLRALREMMRAAAETFPSHDDFIAQYFRSKAMV